MRQMKTQMNIRRLMALLFAVAVCLCSVPVSYAAETSGSCGDNLSWTLEGSTLTISGSGDMTDYSIDNPAPWQEYAADISKLVLPEGITSIGDRAFCELVGLSLLDIPDSVDSIGEMAFYGCAGIRMMDVSDGLQRIGSSAFQECHGLTSLNLPYGVTYIGDQAFWLCSGLRSVKIPSSVTYLGNAVFAYCDELVYADLQASVNTVSKWTFYGCSKLATVGLSKIVTSVDTNAFEGCNELSIVRYEGIYANASSIGESIHDQVDSFLASSVVYSTDNSSSVASSWQEEGTTYFQTNILTQSDSLFVDTTIVYSGNLQGNDDGSLGRFSAQNTKVSISAEVQNDDGWQALVQKTKETLDEYKLQLIENESAIYVEVSIFEDKGIRADQLAQLAGLNVILTVNSISGAMWTVDCSTLDGEKLDGEYNLSYSLSETELIEPVAQKWYALQFAAPVKVNAEIMILLPEAHVKQNASIYQKIDGKMEQIQNTVVDYDGFAHFYLGAVDNVTEYYIGIDVIEQRSADAYVPESLTEAFDVTDTLAPMDYVITGRTSSWGMEIGQVTWIMAGVLVGSVVLIGVVLYLMNKRKLKKGYVVNLDDYEIN